MERFLVKFKSIDGLVLYKPVDERPSDVIYRLGLLPLKAEVWRSDAPSVQTFRRTYRFFSRYVDEQTGNNILEYREQL